jgi:hypothetical protein
VLTLRDVSKIKEHSQLLADNKMLHYYNSCVSHEMLTPLKCLIEIAKRVLKKTIERDLAE